MHFSIVFTVSVPGAPTWLAALLRYPVLAFFAISAGGIGLAIAQGIVLLLVAFHQRFGSKWVWANITLLSLGALGLSAALSSPEDVAKVLAVPFLLIFFFSLLCGTYWFLAAFVFMAFSMTREYWDRGQFRIAQILVAFTWLGA